MITSFDCRDTEAAFKGGNPAKFGNLSRVCHRKLQMLHSAHQLSDLAALPGNRLESLKHTRPGWHSIRVNDKWRICFVWNNGHAQNVEIVDYH